MVQVRLMVLPAFTYSGPTMLALDSMQDRHKVLFHSTTCYIFRSNIIIIWKQRAESDNHILLNAEMTLHIYVLALACSSVIGMLADWEGGEGEGHVA